MKHTPLRRKGRSETAKTKDRIQALLREIVYLRDGGCILRNYKGLQPCSGWNNDGALILQADHLNSRAFNVSYADARLVVCVCKGHHAWRHFTDNNKKKYDEIMRELIGPEREELWDVVENDKKAYPMSSWDWEKAEIALIKDLEILQAQKNLINITS